jgi:hypothetical protein
MLSRTPGERSDENPKVALSRHEIAREHHRSGIGRISSRSFLVRGLEHQLVHHTKDHVIRLDYARSVKVLANFTEHVATLRVDRTHSEGVSISLGIPAYQAQFFGGPHAKELVPANRRFQLVDAGHPNFPVAGSRTSELRRTKRVAAPNLTRFQSSHEPARALFRGAMRESVRHNVALTLPL